MPMRDNSKYGQPEFCHNQYNLLNHQLIAYISHILRSTIHCLHIPHDIIIISHAHPVPAPALQTRHIA